MAKEEIFANLTAADAKGRQAAEAAEHYDYVLTWVEGAINAAVGAAGHSLVEGGYRCFLNAARTQVEHLREHGTGSAANLRTSAAIVGTTDATNTSTLGAAAGAFPAIAGLGGGH